MKKIISPPAFPGVKPENAGLRKLARFLL